MSATTAISQDPTCGRIVNEAAAVIHEERDGVTFYFCSDYCRQKFLSAPADTKADRRLMAAATNIHTVYLARPEDDVNTLFPV